MGERKGQNFYYPPDFDPKVHGSLNGYHGVHALRERARKMDRGILIIRFEMPYNIWCGGCKKHIGMGVRYNAEKTKVGMYYTTPIYQFRMKCHLCTNHFSIKTDPGNMDYVIVDGASRQERRWDPTENGQVVPDDKAVGRKLADDAMYKLEHVKTDKNKMTDTAPRLVGISDIQDRVKDDYLANRILRDKFRKRKKELKAKKDADAAVLKKNSLDIGLVDECPEDVKFAQLLSIQARREAEDLLKEGRAREALEDEDIFQNNRSKRIVASTAKKAIKKVVNLNHIKLLRDKGFGIVSKKSDSTSSCSSSSPMASLGVTPSNETVTSNDETSMKKAILDIPSNEKKPKINSLSLLSNYSDSNEESD